MLIKDATFDRLANEDLLLWIRLRMKWQLLHVLITLGFLACEPISPQTEVDQKTLDASLMDS